MVTQNETFKEKQEKKSALEKEKQEITEEIKVETLENANLKKQKQSLQEKLQNHNFDFFKQTELVLGGGIGATIGLIPGTLAKTSAQVTQEMAIGGVAGAVLGTSAVVVAHVLERKLMEQKLKQTNEQIKESEDYLNMCGEKRADVCNQIQRLQAGKPSKTERKMFKQQAEYGFGRK